MKKSLLLLCFFSLFSLCSANPVKVIFQPESNVMRPNCKQDLMTSLIISAESPPQNKRQRVNLSIALDRSGSMSGEKIVNARNAAQTALEMLNDGDFFSLVIYDSNADVLIPSTCLTPENRSALYQKIESIQPAGSTALFAGVSLSANEIRKQSAIDCIKRIVLLSDGLANVGPSSVSELGQLGAGLGKEGISVSTVGVGTDYNENLMTLLAQNSDGNFYYVANSNDLGHIFTQELGGALQIAAKNVTLKVIAPPGMRPTAVLGLNHKIDGQVIEIAFNQIYAGHNKNIVIQFALAENPEGAAISMPKIELVIDGGSSRLTYPSETTITFSNSEKSRNESINNEASARIAIARSIQLREEAIQEADQGNFDAGAAKMEASITLLSQAPRSPASTMPEILENEITIAKKLPEKLRDQRNYNKSRKEVLGDIYQSNTSQVYRQSSN